MVHQLGNKTESLRARLSDFSDSFKFNCTKQKTDIAVTVYRHSKLKEHTRNPSLASFAYYVRKSRGVEPGNEANIP